MTKHEYAIKSEAAKPARADAVLCVECSERFFTILLAGRQEGKIYFLKYFPLKNDIDTPVAELVREVVINEEYLSEYQDDIMFIYNYSESNLIPAEEYNIHLNQSYIRLSYGDTTKGVVLNEKIPGKELFNVYRIPGDMHAGLQQDFRGGKYWHIYSLMIASDEREEGNRFKLVFSSDKLLVMVHRNGRLQLVNAYAYQTPEDVAYYILSICRMLGMEPEEAHIHVSGLIDSESAIATELEKYFRYVYFGEKGEENQYHQEGEEGQHAIPGHYFSYLVKLALCV